MQLLVHLIFTKKIMFIFVQYNKKKKKRKMPNLSAKERKAKFNTDDLTFRKESNLSSRTLLSLSSYVDIEYNSAESLTNKNKLFETKSKRTIISLAPSRKYTMTEEFKEELRGLKNISNEI